MTESHMPTIRLKPKHHGRVKSGHPWAYSNEIEMTGEASAITPGTLVRLTDSGDAPLGAAMFNPRALIAARLLSRDANTEIDAAFLSARLERALKLRDHLFGEPYYRLVHAEADGLPGLVVDRYGDVAVVEINSAGMDLLRTELTAALTDLLAPTALVIKRTGPARAREGIESAPDEVQGDLPDPVTVEEGGLRFFADPLAGQKTGWFFDQRDNRAAVARLADGARVLDLYCYLGGFGMRAAAAGASEVLCIDRSEPALALAARAADENRLGARCAFQRDNAFDAMERLAADKARFDIVIADPPAFVKSRKDLGAGLKGYRKMMRLALRLVAPGGYLFVASCSQAVEADAFQGELRRALRDSGREGRVLAAGVAGADHPVHPFLPESAYLKSLLLAMD